ncbi:substrate-binding domain-containing protein [Actinomadura sp. ATCC 31491]|uniref:Substrate-binding domain-containing protein n=1 Tax=Actinomadura luzonensis TaxID=2805427 RepID=A0ABT0FKD7_9ACTN|nr:substrate-binding domain-containing protein [Actinomadura luzonensis]MCK2212413.1 substrate-binding domain-containing protein [Actinomadura luzonensis]
MRKQLRKPVSALLIALAIIPAGCSRDDLNPAATASRNTSDRPRIGLVQINQQALFFTQLNEGAQQEAARIGADLTVFNANDDAAQQSQAVTNFIQQGFDAVIVVAIDVEGIKPAIRQAAAAGLKVVAVDAVITDPAVNSQVGVDNKAASKQIGEFVGSYATQHAPEPKIGIVGALNSFIQNIRKDSFETTVKAAGARVLQTVDGKNTQEGAAAAAENLLTAQPNLDIVYATGEPALLGTVAAVEARAAADHVKVFGWDLTKQAINGIDRGYVAGVVQQNPLAEGQEAVKAADALIRGLPTEKTINVPVTIVTKDNVDSYRSAFA